MKIELSDCIERVVGPEKYKEKILACSIKIDNKEVGTIEEVRDLKTNELLWRSWNFPKAKRVVINYLGKEFKSKNITGMEDTPVELYFETD